MNNLRKWGQAPYRIAVVHGGPGALGSAAGLARELLKDRGVLEPLQTKDSIWGQVNELADILKQNAALPVTLIGWSWGATLSLLTTARFPALVKKLVLIGTSPLFNPEAMDNTPVYMERLSEAQRREYFTLVDTIQKGKASEQDASLGQLMSLLRPAEIFDPLPYQDETLEIRYDINRKISQGVKKLLESGQPARLCREIKCPVTAIHGDYDPRPAAVVQESLGKLIKDFKFVLLVHCGHTPWLEKQARNEFFRVLREEIG